MFSLSWLIPLLPFLSFLLLALFVAPRSRQAAAIIGTISVATAALFSALLCWEYYQLYPMGAEHPSIVAWSFEWLRYGPFLSVTAGVLVDPASLLLMLVVTTVSTAVHVYSIGYMADDQGSGRYFTYMSLFTFSMLGLVIAPNILQTYFFWELVGVSSFLLIGFYYQKESAVAAAKKAFIVTRFADLFFLIGVLLLGYFGYQQLAQGVSPDSSVQAFDFAFLNSSASTASLEQIGILTTAAILIFIGAAGKSAMFPLHVWLPDAMEGPTPVSALIHAATMVVAGVYLVARLFPLFAASGTALTVVAIVGAFTCLFAAVIACTQDDIKRVLAFSTLSQLGYMMLALGVATYESAAGYTASLFHLFTHAMFKALLFLGAGAVIHAVHSNNPWGMGGLAKKMPYTHLTFLIATLAIAGVPPLSGFFSKDMILASALENGHPVLFGVGLLVAGLTAFYMMRLYLLTFAGESRSEAASYAREAPLVMLIPLLILALLSAITGLLPIDQFVWIGKEHASHHGWLVPILAVSAGAFGIAVAWFVYGGNLNRSEQVVKSLGPLYPVIENKFYIDEIYLYITRRVIFPFVSAPIAWFDRHIVDGAVNLTGRITQMAGTVLSHLQTGQIQTYGLWLVNGAVIVAMLLWGLSR